MKYLLLLHGYTQNNSIFYKKIKKNLLKSHINEFIVILPKSPFIINDDPQCRGWWRLSCSNIYAKPHTYKNYEMSINEVQFTLQKLLKSTWNKKEDQLYIIAFSQGAVLAELMYITNIYPIKPHKIILISPSGIMDNKLRTSIKKHGKNKILIIMGKKEKEDFGISYDTYMKYGCIDSFSFLLHEQGHVIPNKLDERKKILKWLDIKI